MNKITFFRNKSCVNKVTFQIEEKFSKAISKEVAISIDRYFNKANKIHTGSNVSDEANRK